MSEKWQRNSFLVNVTDESEHLTVQNVRFSDLIVHSKIIIKKVTFN